METLIAPIGFTNSIVCKLPSIYTVLGLENSPIFAVILLIIASIILIQEEK